MSPRGPRARTAADSVVVVDKPAGITSHDVVARVRKVMGTRKVGHAGTLDPMATGVLVLGVERATRLLGHLQLRDKAYAATIRLGVGTVTDDREGDVISTADASGLTREQIEAVLPRYTGAILQRPTSVSAVKVDGQRAYALVRAGAEFELAARPVTVRRLELTGVRAAEQDGVPVLDVDVEVECSSGTYVRALARDVGADLGVGGHLTALRRTRVGPFDVAAAHPLDALSPADAIPLPVALELAYPRVDVDADAAVQVLHGAQLPAGDLAESAVVGLFGPDGSALSVARNDEGVLVALVVFS